MNAIPLRKKIRHFDVPGHARLLTFSCCHRKPLLAGDLWRKMLSCAIDRAGERHKYSLVAFVYMPEHVHVILHPKEESCRIKDWLQGVKKPFSDQVKKQLVAVDSPLLRQLSVHERPGKTAFRFWQKGPGHDRNINSPDMLRDAVDYVHNNPVRRGLCATPDQWRWSSWKYYHDGGKQDDDLPRIDGFPL